MSPELQTAYEYFATTLEELCFDQSDFMEWLHECMLSTPENASVLLGHAIDYMREVANTGEEVRFSKVMAEAYYRAFRAVLTDEQLAQMLTSIGSSMASASCLNNPDHARALAGVDTTNPN